jgi:hypothetical protein
MIGPADLNPSPAPRLKTSQMFSDLLPETSKFQHYIEYTPNVEFY